MEEKINKLANDLEEYLGLKVHMIEFKEYVETCGFLFHFIYEANDFFNSCKALFILFDRYFPQMTIKIKDGKIIIIFRFHTYVDSFDNIIEGKALPISNFKNYYNLIEETDDFILITASHIQDLIIPKTKKNIYIVLGSVINEMTLNPSYEYKYGNNIVNK